MDAGRKLALHWSPNGEEPTNEIVNKYQPQDVNKLSPRVNFWHKWPAQVTQNRPQNAMQQLEAHFEAQVCDLWPSLPGFFVCQQEKTWTNQGKIEYEILSFKFWWSNFRKGKWSKRKDPINSSYGKLVKTSWKRLHLLAPTRIPFQEFLHGAMLVVELWAIQNSSTLLEKTLSHSKLLIIQ